MTPERPQVHDPASSILDKMRKEYAACIARFVRPGRPARKYPVELPNGVRVVGEGSIRYPVVESVTAGGDVRYDPLSVIGCDRARAHITRLSVPESNTRRETSMNERNVSKELDRLADERWPLTLAVEATPDATLVCAWLTDWPGYISQGSSVNEALARLRVMLPACWAAHLQHGWDYVVSMKPSPTPNATLDNARFSTNDIWASVQWRAGTFRVADLSPHQTDACESH